MTVAADPPRSARKTLTVCGGAHALQAQFGLSYAAIGALKAVYSGAMASGPIPSIWLAGKVGGVAVPVFGTALVGAG